MANLFFYAWGEPVFVLLMLFSTVSDYIHGYLINKYRQRKKLAKGFVVSAVVINILMLGIFKYTGFICESLNILPFINLPVPEIPLPLGISFYTFQTMSYSIDVYRGDAPVQKNIISFGTYVSLFPQLIAGPIVRYKDVAEQIDNRRENLDDFTKGVRKFLVGLGKKVLIANQMGFLWDTVRADYSGNGIVISWIGIIAYSFQIYFDFSGYSDMACGLGNMFGFEFLKNFNYPYISKSITEFWRRWHISLGTWFREYVYIPLGGNRKGKKRLFINIFVVWFLTGFWHGASWNFILWGLYFGIILIIEKFFLLKQLEKLPSFISHIYSVFLIILGWVIFYFEDLGEMFRFTASLFDFSAGAVNGDVGITVISYIPMLIIALIASLPLGSLVYEKVKGIKGYWIVDSILCTIILFLCTASLVSDGYNPFLYLRF